MNGGFHWIEYLRLAEHLVSDTAAAGASSRAAAARCAISRAYYAAAMSARDLIRAQGVALTASRSIHQQIHVQLLTSQDPRWRKAGDYLRMLRNNRNLADYEGHYNAVGEVMLSLEAARRCVSLLRPAPPGADQA